MLDADDRDADVVDDAGRLRGVEQPASAVDEHRAGGLLGRAGVAGVDQHAAALERLGEAGAGRQVDREFRRVATQRPDLVAAPLQLISDRAADRSRCSGYGDAHARSIADGLGPSG